MAESAVINASPLIFLSRGGHLELLKHFAERIIVPTPVAIEIRAKGPDDVAAKALDNTTWLECQEPPLIPEIILNWGIGMGESAVLAVARSQPGMDAIIDDLAGRRCASSLGIPVRGTLGIVLVAKQRGYIPAARPVMEALIQAGLYLSRTVLDNALQRVNE